METEGEAGVGMASTPLWHGICEKYLGKMFSEVYLFSGGVGIPWMCCVLWQIFSCRKSV